MSRAFLVSCLVTTGVFTGCAGERGESTVADDRLPDASAISEGGSADASVDDASTDTSDRDAAIDAREDASDGAGPACVPPTESCGAECFDLTSTKQHCGSCDNMCIDGAGTAVCGDRACGCVDPAHKYCENAGCFATDTDSQHCGDDCKVCPASSTCTGGSCVCDSGFAECQPGTCTSLLTEQNCGRCGNTCGAGASCVDGKCRFAQSGPSCPPWDLAHGATTGSIYWTELCGSNAAIRSCPVASGCQTAPDALYGAASGSLPCGIAAVTANDGKEYYFNTDNQAPSNRLWRSLSTGANRTDWGGFSTGGPSAIVTNGTSLWWGTGSGVYRSQINSTGATLVLDANPSITTSSAPQGVAIDATNVYAARQGVSGKQDGVVACPLGSDCSTTGELQMFVGSGVTSIVSDGVNLFVATRTIGVDSVYRCPLAGCAAGATPFWTANVAVNPGRPIPLAVDANNVYINSRSGNLLECPKNAATCAAPKVLHDDVNAGSMMILDDYVYWTEGTAPRGIYRTLP